MNAVMLIILGLIVFFCLSALFAAFSDPARVNDEEAHRVWRKSKRSRRVRT